MFAHLQPTVRERLPELMDDPALDEARHFRALDGLS
jgi:hypothetical protein